jgi:hypothetical protein
MQAQRRAQGRLASAQTGLSLMMMASLNTVTKKMMTTQGQT